MGQNTTFVEELDFVEAKCWCMHKEVRVGILLADLDEYIVNMFAVGEESTCVPKLCHPRLECWAIAFRKILN